MSLLNYDFDADYDLMLSAWGEGRLCEEGLLDSMKPESILREFEEEYHRYPVDISLFIDDPFVYGYDYGFTSVDTALLEKLTTLRELILPDSIKDLDVTPGLKEIFRKNGTLIRGTFDSFAERFAAENGLNFRPSDYIFARHFFEPAQESTVMTLVFGRDGSVFVKEDTSSPGWAASNSMGGSFVYELGRDFYKKTPEKIAEQFRSVMYDATIESGKLAEFIEKAKTHKYYKGKN